MNTQENSTGKPLADANWLKNHHIAKMIERTAFAKKLAALHPKKIIDLGCASGLWLELLNDIIPDECEFIGIESDSEALEMAIQKSKSWNRKSSFIQLNIEADADKIPVGDLTLAFNIFPYIKDIDSFLNTLALRNPRGILVVRQYDGASIRFGPMPTAKRQKIESELRVALENSEKFRHYDMDRVITALHNSPFKHDTFDFELFARSSPFDEKFIPYYQDTLMWTCQYLSKSSADYLTQWINDDALILNRYFFEVDLVAILS